MKLCSSYNHYTTTPKRHYTMTPFLILQTGWVLALNLQLTDFPFSMETKHLALFFSIFFSFSMKVSFSISSLIQFSPKMSSFPVSVVLQYDKWFRHHFQLLSSFFFSFFLSCKHPTCD